MKARTCRISDDSTLSETWSRDFGLQSIHKLNTSKSCIATTGITISKTSAHKQHGQPYNFSPDAST